MSIYAPRPIRLARPTAMVLTRAAAIAIASSAALAVVLASSVAVADDRLGRRRRPRPAGRCDATHRRGERDGRSVQRVEPPRQRGGRGRVRLVLPRRDVLPVVHPERWGRQLVRTSGGEPADVAGPERERSD